MRRVVFIASAIGLAAALVLAACGSDDPSQTVDQGAELFTMSFDSPGSWEEGTTSDSALAIVDGRYQINHRAESSASFAWGIGGETVENVIIDVTAEQLSAEKDNLYGILCRLGEDSRGNAIGYALLISGDGHFGIAELRSNSLSFLLEWHQTDVIHQGQATNTIRAVCVEDYLAVYANDTFLGDVKDNMFQGEGRIGLIAGVTETATASITFDNLTVYEGTLSD